MKSMRQILFAALALVFVCAAATIVVIKRQAASEAAKAATNAEMPVR